MGKANIISAGGDEAMGHSEVAQVAFVRFSRVLVKCNSIERAGRRARGLY